MSNLIVPIDVQALRLKRARDKPGDEPFSGATTAYERLPKQGDTATPNVASTILRSLTDDATQSLDQGVHLHWALPRALTRGVQQADGTLVFLPAPNRWLVTRLLRKHDGTVSSMQWIVESDFLMTEEEYRAYSSASNRASVAVPVGWPGAGDPHDEPWRRLGKVFRWREWAPAASPSPGAPRTAARHLDEIASPRALGPLRAVGHSGPAFAAYYPDCKSAFGFYDAFREVGIDLAHDAFRVSYHISGWHSRPDDDPLAPARLAAERRATDADDRALIERCYGWSYTEGATTPERTLYSGHVVGIPWKSDDSYPAPLASATSTPVRIAVGNSQSEALAALIKEESKAGWIAAAPSNATDAAETDLEIFLDGLQLGLVHRRTETQPTIALEQALHQQGFASYPGGRAWLVRKKGSPAEASGPLDSADPMLPGEHDLPRLLCELNAAQAELDAHAAVIESMQRQLFLDWCQYTLANARGDPLANDLQQQVAAQLTAIWRLCEKTSGAKPTTDGLPSFFSGKIQFDPHGAAYTDSPPKSLTGGVVERASKLRATLQESFPQLELQVSNAPRFWAPNDPVIVLSGEALTPARRTGDTGVLTCRLTPELIGAVHVQAGSASASLTATDAIARFDLARADLVSPTPENAATRPLLADLAALAAEAVLVDPTTLPAALLGVPTNADSKLAEDAGAAAATAIRSAREGHAESSVTANGAQVTWSGSFPAGLALTGGDSSWTDPFLPLFLAWSMQYRAFARKRDGTSDGTYEPGYVKDRFRFDDNLTDLTLDGASVPDPLDSLGMPLTGAIILSSRTADPLVAQLSALRAEGDTRNADLEALIGRYQTRPPLSQGLHGFNESLLSHGVGLQMTPFDPNDVESSPFSFPDYPAYSGTLTQYVARTVGVQTDRMPNGETLPYRPLRAGYLELDSLLVVDVFGRRLSLPAETVVASWRLKPPAGARPAVFLPPRIAQPARLQCRWLCAENDDWESDDQPESSPICGWIVPNHLENSLMLFSGDGALLGSAGVFGGGKHVTWQSRPGTEWQQSDPDLASANRYLREFVLQRLFGRPASFFADLMAAIENARTLVLPHDKDSAQAQAVLMGWPLALVRVGLKLELQGLPAFDTSPAAIRHDTAPSSSYDWTKRSFAGLLDIDIPVRIGQLHHIDDGLVAFVRDGDATVYAPAYAAAPGAPADDAKVAAPQDDTVTLKLSPRQLGAQTRTTFTLLVDPRASLHVSTGLLPVKTLDVPSTLYAQALRAIEMAFLVNPVVGAPHELTLPVPSEPGFVWGWTPGGAGDRADLPVTASPYGDRARFGYSPQIVRDGWLRLKPQPARATDRASAGARTKR